MTSPLNLRFAALCLICCAPSTLPSQTKCGVERWPVKTWIDDDAARVDTVPIPITVAELANIPRPQTRFPQRNRVPGPELQTFVLRARFMEARPQDDDSDIHLVVRDLEIEEATLVTEIPHPDCVYGNERLARIYDETLKALRTVGRNDTIEITGIGFFDDFHGQRGMAPNGIEIHPILKLRVVGRATDSTKALRPQQTGDTITMADSVWINSSSGVYHCPGTRYFGKTVRGRFTSEREALQSGARPAGGRRCGK